VLSSLSKFSSSTGESAHRAKIAIDTAWLEQGEQAKPGRSDDESVRPQPRHEHASSGLKLESFVPNEHIERTLENVEEFVLALVYMGRGLIARLHVGFQQGKAPASVLALRKERHTTGHVRGGRIARRGALIGNQWFKHACLLEEPVDVLSQISR
jgi:hypothetical protein